VADRQTFFISSSPIEKSKLPLNPVASLGRDKNMIMPKGQFKMQVNKRMNKYVKS